MAEWWTFSTVGPSELPEYTEDWCAADEELCFYPLPDCTYTQIEGQIRSYHANQHGVACYLWDYAAEEWEFIGSIQIPAGSNDWHSFNYSIPNMNTTNHLLFTTNPGADINAQNGKLYYVGEEVTLEKCITLRDDTWSCDPYTPGSCNCGDEGPQQNTFDYQLPMLCYSKITGAVEGVRHAMVFFFDWGDGLYPVWWNEWDPLSWPGYACFWAWPSIGSQFGNGIGVIGIYIDGFYIGQSNQFTITGAPQGAIIDWWRKDPRIGPFTLGQSAVVIGGELTNTGSSGFYYFKLVQNPGTPQENLLSLHGNDLDAGQVMGFGHNLTMPTVAGIYTLGLKIWGDGQNEPSWGSANTQIWDIYVGVVPPCEEYWFQWECEDNGCYWYDGSCHSALPCLSYSTQSACEAANCYWWNGSCHDNPPSYCSDLNNQTDCELYGCYWYNNSCHSEPLQDICAWIIDQIIPGQPVTTIPITSVIDIIDSFVLQTPPSGYSFIPTLQQVFGVIDYYLGFDGDEKTGCDFVEEIYPCSHWTTEQECEAHGCQWIGWLNTCFEYP